METAITQKGQVTLPKRVHRESRSLGQSGKTEAFGILCKKFHLLVGTQVGRQARNPKLRIDGVQSFGCFLSHVSQVGKSGAGGEDA